MDFFLKLQNTFSAYKSEQEETVVLFEDLVKTRSRENCVTFGSVLDSTSLGAQLHQT